ncbi:MAG: tetratricopeptide repeat protein [Cyanothece sp. SIO1E1]|nr:tetratricopeptide repeat protein [Cyanothece sp. SIO1E1]
MVQATNLAVENQRNYQKLVVSIEASEGILNLLIAACDDLNLREQIIRRYETELAPDIRSYRLQLDFNEPSLRMAIAKRVTQEPDLQTDSRAVFTVTGAESLWSRKAERSEKAKFFGYLQWTREGLREFRYPIVLWVTHQLLVDLSQQAPDFWSWRGGVFRFAPEKTTAQIVREAPRLIQTTEIEDPHLLPLADLKNLIDQTEQQQGPQSPLLSTLYYSLGRVYQRRLDQYEAEDHQQERQLAIQALEKAITLQTQLGLEVDLQLSLKRLGDICFKFKDDIQRAFASYNQALNLSRKTNDRLGEANTLQAIGDVLQFLDRRSEALENYEQALAFYRQVGDRLGEANTLQAIGDVLQFLKRSSEALENYEQALAFYRQVGDRLGEANTLKAIGDVLQFLKRSSEALENYEQALAFYRQVGDRLGEANTLKAVGDVLQFLDRRSEALENYEQALAFYRQVGARLGEANTLKAVGKLQEDPAEGLNYLQQCQEIYVQIGDRYSQSRNLLFIAEIQRNLGEREATIYSLHQASELASEIGYEPLQQYAQSALENIQNESENTQHQVLPKWLQSFIQFSRRGWIQFALCFVIGLVTFPLILIVLVLFYGVNRGDRVKSN